MVPQGGGAGPRRCTVQSVSDVWHRAGRSRLLRSHMWCNVVAAALSGDDRKFPMEIRDSEASKMTAAQIGKAQEMARRCQQSKLRSAIRDGTLPAPRRDKANNHGGLMPISTLLLVSLFALTSCMSVEPQQFRGPNGKTAYSMRCSGMGRTMEECYRKAGEVCPDGYTIVDRTSSIVGVPSQGGSLITTKQGLAIECK